MVPSQRSCVVCHLRLPSGWIRPKIVVCVGANGSIICRKETPWINFNQGVYSQDVCTSHFSCMHSGSRCPMFLRSAVSCLIVISWHAHLFKSKPVPCRKLQLSPDQFLPELLKFSLLLKHIKTVLEACLQICIFAVFSMLAYLGWLLICLAVKTHGKGSKTAKAENRYKGFRRNLRRVSLHSFMW